MIGSLIIVGLIGVVIITTTIIIFYKSLHKDDHEYRDDTIIENYMPQYTGGFSQGSLIEILKGPNNRMGLVFLPKDVDFLRKTAKGEKLEIKPQVIFAPIQNIIPLARGTLSMDRNLIKVFPENSEDLPIEFRNSKWGTALMKNVADIKAETTTIDVQRREIEVQDFLLKRTQGKDRFLETLKLDDVMWRDNIKKFADRTDSKKFSANIPFGQQQNFRGD